MDVRALGSSQKLGGALLYPAIAMDQALALVPCQMLW
jgi:hypothetical protein